MVHKDWLICSFFIILLAACSSARHVAPVVSIATIDGISKTGQHAHHKKIHDSTSHFLYSKKSSMHHCQMAMPIHWHWPAQGSVRGFYSSFNKGINITGKIGGAVFATAAGQVVYQGNGLRGYGNLIIIKHNSAWLSAYAWNQNILVHRGECVYAGQPIAKMGRVMNQSAMLHFEIRQNGLPVNPLHYLTARS